MSSKNACTITRKENLTQERILITQGRILDPTSSLDIVGDLAIEAGRIIAIGNVPSSFSPDKTIDAQGLWVVPGLLDLHVHLREPGREDKETIETGTAAAAAGGFTSIACMPNTDPVIDNDQKVQYVIRQNKGGYCRVYPIGAITKKSEGAELAPYDEMKEAGACALTDVGPSSYRSDLLKNAFTYAKMVGLPIFAHCENRDLAKGSMNEGAYSIRMGERGTPTIAEDIEVARHILMAEYLKTPLHICHVSSKGALTQIRYAKARGVQVTAETAPHYFTYTDSDVFGYQSNKKTSPPLRLEEDRQAIIEALKDGTLDAIASDHEPHTLEDKEGEFDQAAPGVVGLETIVGAAITHLIVPGHLSPLELVDKLSSKPHAILGVKGGNLRLGSKADITLINPTTTWIVDPKQFFSKGVNSAYEGETLTGQVTHTINGGKIVFQRS